MAKRECRATFISPNRRMELVIEKEVGQEEEKGSLTVWVNNDLYWNDCGSAVEMFEQAVDFMKQYGMRIDL